MTGIMSQSQISQTAAPHSSPSAPLRLRTDTDAHLRNCVLPVILSLQVLSVDGSRPQAAAVDGIRGGRHRASGGGLAHGRIQESQEVGQVRARLHPHVIQLVHDDDDDNVAIEETAGTTVVFYSFCC